MNCPRCKSIEHLKSGIVQGHQRYTCKSCNYHYTVLAKSDVKSAETRRMVFEMYLEGLGFRAIGRILKTSYSTVCQLVRKSNANLELPDRKTSIKMVELDEIHTYVNYRWIWIAVDRYGKRFISFVCGDR